jgi:hypothetical protein
LPARDVDDAHRPVAGGSAAQSAQPAPRQISRMPPRGRTINKVLLSGDF